MKNTRLVTASLIASIFAGLSAMGVVSAARSSDSCTELEVMLDALAGKRVALRDMRGPLYGDGTDGGAWRQYKVAAAAIQAIPKFYRQTSAAAAATTEAEFLLERGESVRAVQHLLDAQQMARDLLQSPLQIEEAIGCAYVVPGSMARFLEPGGLDRFSDEAVALWLDGVERMQASFGAASRSYAGDLECYGWSVLSAIKSSGKVPDDLGMGQAKGFSKLKSRRGHVLDYFRAAYALLNDVEASHGRPVEERLVVLERINAELMEVGTFEVSLQRSDPLGSAQRRIAAFSRLECLRALLATR